LLEFELVLHFEKSDLVIIYVHFMAKNYFIHRGDAKNAELIIFLFSVDPAFSGTGTPENNKKRIFQSIISIYLVFE